MKRKQISNAARFLAGLFLFVAAICSASSLSSTSLTIPSSGALVYGKLAPQSVTARPANASAVKKIVQGIYDPNGSKATGTVIGGANCSAMAVRHRVVLQATGDLLGVPVINDCKTTSGVIVGEGGQTDAVEVYGNLIYKGIAYPLYFNANGGVDARDRVGTFAAGERIVGWLKGAIPVVKGEVVYIQLSWDGATAAINFPRQRAVDLNLDEGYLFFTDADPAVNETASRAASDVNQWIPLVGNQKKADMTANTTRLPAPAGLLIEVASDLKHFIIRGDSRAIDNHNKNGDPPLASDSYIAAAVIARGFSAVNHSVGASLGVNDVANAQYTANRRWMEQGGTHVLDASGQNDLANDLSISDLQRRWVREYDFDKALGRTVVRFTIDPYTTTSVAGDWTLFSTQTIADSDHSTKRTRVNTWLRAARNTTCTGGNPTTKLYMVCDRVLDTSTLVEYASDRTLWKSAATADTGTATSTSATTLTASAETWTPYAYPERYVVTLTAADAITKGTVTSNAPAALAITSTTLTVASWSNGTAGNKAFTIYNTFTNDGIHATYYANRLKQATVETYVGGTAATFSLASIPWADFWIADARSLFTDTGCSIAPVATDPVSVWVGSINGLKATGTTTARPTYSPTSGSRGAILFDGTDDSMVFTSALASIARKQHRIMIVTVYEMPDSNATARSLFFISNNASNTRVNLYHETGGGASTGLPASASRIDEAGTTNTDNWPTAYAAGTITVRIDYVDWQEQKQLGWINGVMKLDDTAAWTGGALSVDTDSAVVNMGRGSTTPLNCRVLGVGVIANYEPTPYIVSTLTTYLTTLSNWTPSTAAEEAQGSLIAEINRIGAARQLAVK